MYRFGKNTLYCGKCKSVSYELKISKGFRIYVHPNSTSDCNYITVARPLNLAGNIKKVKAKLINILFDVR